MRLLVLALAFGAAIPGMVVAQASPARTATTRYTVQPGDTLEGLAVRYLRQRSDAYIVQRVNSVNDTFRMRVGMALRIPNELLRNEPVPMVVRSVTGTVVRTTAVGLSDTLAKGSTIREGDRIATTANAFVTLRQGDGSQITLPSNTTLRIVSLHRVMLETSANSAFVVEHGKGEVRVTPLHKAADRFEIRTPASVAAVRGTEFRVAYDADTSLSRLEVIEGRVGETPPTAADVAPAAPASEALVTTGEAALRKLGGERRIIPLPQAPRLKERDAVRTTPEPIFRIANPHPGWTYHFTLARDKAFGDIIAEQYTTGIARFIGSPQGTLSLRISAVDENGIEGFTKAYLVVPPLVGAEARSNSALAEMAPSTSHGVQSGS